MNETLQKLLDAVKGLTWVNVGILAALVLISIPAYFAWRVINNPTLMGAVLSEFREIHTKTDCSLYYAQVAGSAPAWGIANQFAERNSEEWAIVVRVKFEPDEAAMKDYCQATENLIRFMHDDTLQPPTFPGSTRLIIYRDQHPGKDGP